MTDLVIAVRLTADGKSLSGEIRGNAEDLRRMGEAADQANNRGKSSAEQFTASLKRQADTLGMSKTQVMAYDASQQKLTQAQRDSTAESIKAIDAHERQGQVLSRVRMAAAGAGAALVAGFVGALKSSVSAAIEAEQSSLRLEAVLKATGHAAGLTKNELDAMAESMKGRTGFDDDQVRRSMAVLLTFKQVQKESFGEALEVAANIAKVMGTDLQSATLQLGKALEDPEQGLAALTRSGVSFNSSQKEMIKGLVEVGQQSQAVTLILQTMKQQGLDGVAEAMNQGLYKSTNDLKLAWDDLLKALGRSDAVKAPVEGVLGAITGRLEAMRAVMEGDWVDRVLAIASFVAPFGGSEILEVLAMKRAAEAVAAQKKTGDDDLDAQIGGAMKARVAAIEKGGEFLQRYRSDAEKLEDETRKWRNLGIAAGFTAQQIAEGESKIRSAMGKKGPEVQDPYPQLVKGLEQKLYLDKESTEQEKLQLALGELTAAQLAKLGAKKIELLRLMAAEVDQKRADAEASKSWLETAKIITDAEDRQGAAAAEFNQAASERIQAINDETLGYTRGERAKEKAIELAKLEAQYLSALSKVREGDIEAMDRVTAIYEQRRGELETSIDARAGAREASEQIKRNGEEQKRLNDELGRGLTDSIFRGLEAGKGFARNFFDSLKNAAQTTILKPVVQFMVQPITSAASSALGMLGIPGLGNAAGLGNIFMNGGGIGGGIGQAVGMGGGYGGGIFGALGGAQTMADFGNFFGSIGSVTEAGGTFGMMDAIGGFAAANPYAAAAIAAAALLGGKSLFGGGGGGPASFTGLDVQGSVSRSGFDGTFYGNSRNSQEAFRWATHDHGATEGFNSAITQLYTGMEGLGRMLGLDTSRLASTTAPYSAAGIDPRNGIDSTVQQLGAALSQVSDQLALQLMPNLKEFAQANETATQTLTRLANAQRQADLSGIFTRMNAAMKLYDDTSGLFTSNLSPLTAGQRLAYSGSQYAITLAQSQSGDVNAMGRLAGAAQSYLTEARSYYASSQQYTDIFNRVMDQTQGLVADTLAQQAAQFASMGLSLDDIAQNTENLDGRISVALNAAVGAWQTADAVLQEQLRAALGDIGVNLYGLDASINNELRASVAAPLREQLLQMLTASDRLAAIAGNTYNLGGTLDAATGSAATQIKGALAALDSSVNAGLSESVAAPLREQLLQLLMATGSLQSIAGSTSSFGGALDAATAGAAAQVNAAIGALNTSLNTGLTASVSGPLREQLVQAIAAGTTLSAIASNTTDLGGTLAGAVAGLADSFDAPVSTALQSVLAGPLHEQFVQQAASAAALRDISGDMKKLASDMATQLAAKIVPVLAAQIEATRQSGATVATAVGDAKAADALARESSRTSVWIDNLTFTYNGDGQATGAYNSDGELIGPGFRVALGITSSSDG